MPVSARSAAQTAAALPKPLLRGWFHAFAAVGAVVITIGLLLHSWRDFPGDYVRLASLVVFGLSMIELYTVSAIYHVGAWQGTRRTVLRSLDHANIYVLIAGTYTPICVNVLDGWLRPTMLTTIWVLAIAGIATAVLTIHLPRFAVAGLYLGMGWVSLISLPDLWAKMQYGVLAIIAGGLLYTLGAVVYGLRWPNPLPRIFGFHEIFHLFVIAGSAAFAVSIWWWVLPYPRA